MTWQNDIQPEELDLGRRNDSLAPDSQLRRAATAIKGLSIGLMIFVALYFFTAVFQNTGPLGLLALIVALFFIARGFFEVSAVLDYSVGLQFFLFFLMFLPVIQLIVLLFLILKARRFVSNLGTQPSLFGVNSRQI